MTSRTYAQIICSLPSSKKLRRLKTPVAKWAYVCTHLSLLGNYSGMFRYPRVMFADDVGVNLEKLDMIIQDLVSVGLIEYNADEEIVRIIGWFNKKNCPENASRAISQIKDYLRSEMPFSPMLVRSIAEFSVGVIKRSQNWDPEGNRKVLWDQLGPFLIETYKTVGSDFLDAISTELDHAGKSTADDLIALLPPLTQYRAGTVAAPCGHTRRDDTALKKDKNKEKEKTANNDAAIQSRPVSGGTHKKPGESRKGNSSGVTMPCEETKRSALVVNK